jgi:carboxyl-terminal processing protease
LADPAKAIQATAPAVVLVNHGTSGPAELVAAALEDNKRAEAVGERTFGEGAQQKVFVLPDGSALILSVAKYESPAGKVLQDEGVTPAVVVESGQDQEAGPEEEPGPVTTAPVPVVKKPAVQVDEQLTKALEILKGKTA